MALKNQISNDEYQALPDALKEHYKEGDGGYTLDHDEVGTLKASLDRKDTKLAEKDRTIAQLQSEKRSIEQRFEGLDPDAAREAVRQVEENEGRQLIDKGQFDAALTREKEKHAREMKAEKERFEKERAYTSSLLVNNDLRRLLTAGQDAEGNAIPVVAPELLDGAEALLRAKYTPKVIEDGDSRKAVFDVDGMERDMADYVMREWLPSDSAKAFTIAPENSGGHRSSSRPGAGKTPAGVKLIPRDQADQYIDEIAKGTVQIESAA